MEGRIFEHVTFTTKLTSSDQYVPLHVKIITNRYECYQYCKHKMEEQIQFDDWGFGPHTVPPTAFELLSCSTFTPRLNDVCYCVACHTAVILRTYCAHTAHIKSFYVSFAQLVEALRYKPEGREFDPRW
jgi:hypothetical protein